MRKYYGTMEHPTLILLLIDFVFKVKFLNLIRGCFFIPSKISKL